MKKFFLTHTEWILIAAGALVVFVLGWFLVWGVTALAENLSDSLAPAQQPSTLVRFQLDAAAKLNFRGLNGS